MNGAQRVMFHRLWAKLDAGKSVVVVSPTEERAVALCREFMEYLTLFNESDAKAARRQVELRGAIVEFSALGDRVRGARTVFYDDKDTQ